LTLARWDFQLACAERVTGKILNVGCKEDGAGLKQLYGDRVVNLDRYDYDEDAFDTDHKIVPIKIDIKYDILNLPFTFAKDNEYDLVILGDILEHLPEDKIPAILKEIYRIANHLCITSPQDERGVDPHHITLVTLPKLKKWLADVGWKIRYLMQVNYLIVPEGHFVYAGREDLNEA